MFVLCVYYYTVLAVVKNTPFVCHSEHPEDAGFGSISCCHQTSWRVFGSSSTGCQVLINSLDNVQNFFFFPVTKMLWADLTQPNTHSTKQKAIFECSSCHCLWCLHCIYFFMLRFNLMTVFKQHLEIFFSLPLVVLVNESINFFACIQFKSRTTKQRLLKGIIKKQLGYLVLS